MEIEFLSNRLKFSEELDLVMMINSWYGYKHRYGLVSEIQGVKGKKNQRFWENTLAVRGNKNSCLRMYVWARV